MPALTKTLANALRSLAAAESTWTITMVDDYYKSALKLEELGLVRFKPRVRTRGRFAGLPNGYDVVVTAEGKAAVRGTTKGGR